eukprot:scaffold5278_cov128-Amphora_coffeaeformis.AAC.1
MSRHTAAVKIPFRMPHSVCVDRRCVRGFYPNRSIWMPCWWMIPPRPKPERMHPRPHPAGDAGGVVEEVVGDVNKQPEQQHPRNYKYMCACVWK